MSRRLASGRRRKSLAGVALRGGEFSRQRALGAELWIWPSATATRRPILTMRPVARSSPPVVIRHDDCDQPIHAVLECNAGHRPLNARDTHPTPGPGASLARADQPVRS